MSQQVLITGGLGYLGGRVSSFLNQQNSLNVTALTRNPSKYTLSEVPFSVKKIDWDDPVQMKEVFAPADIIIHFAAMNEVEAGKHPKLAITQTGEYTERIFKSLNLNRKVRFINISTARVYTNPFSTNVTEDSPKEPKHPYGIAHLESEKITNRWGQKHNLTCINIRLSNCLGAPLLPEVDRWTLLINELSRDVIRENKLVLKSPGLQRRDFMTITDLSRALLHIINLDDQIIKNEDFNLGSGWTPQIKEVAELIKERCQSVLKINPELIVPASKEPFVDESLNYNNKKFIDTGFHFENDYRKELDEMLLFCQKHFL